MVKFESFYGIVTEINDWAGQNSQSKGCYKIFTVEDDYGSIVNFIISPTTYFLDHVKIEVGDRIFGYYDGNAPVPLIYPPQFRALVIVKDSPYQNVKVDYFNERLISSDGLLKLNISPYTEISLRNGQTFSSPPYKRNLIVVYGATTKSIPAQTSPYRIIVWCN